MKVRASMAVAGLFAVMAAVFVHPIFRGWDMWGIQDWDNNLFFNAVARVSMLQHHEIPLWNPWYCGGAPLLARAESHFLSPLFGVILAFGELAGLKILIVVHLWIGLLGGYWLGRTLGCSRLAAILSGLVFMMSGAFALHVAAGNTWVMNMAWMPWACACWVRAVGAEGKEKRVQGSGWRAAITCAVFLALMWLGGGPYPLVLTLIFMGCFWGFGALTGEYAGWPTLRKLVVIVVLLFVLGAVKFLPAVEFHRAYPRVQHLYTGFSLQGLVFCLFNRDLDWHAVEKIPETTGFVTGASHAMNEVGAYVGIVPAVLFLWGAARAGRQRRTWLLCFALMVWLGFGVRAPVNLWGLLHRLPLFEFMRVAERFRFVFVLILAVFAGIGLDGLRAWVGRVSGRVGAGSCVAAVVVLVVYADLCMVVSPVFAEAFRIAPMRLAANLEMAPVHVAERRFMASGRWMNATDDAARCTWSAYYPAFLANQGVLSSYDDMPVPMRAVPAGAVGYRGECWLTTSSGRVSNIDWKPNRVSVAVDVAEAGSLIFNQNYYPGWTTSDGRAVVSRDGLLAVAVGPAAAEPSSLLGAAGDEEIELRYWPRSVVVGAGISGVSWVGVVLALWRMRRGRG